MVWRLEEWNSVLGNMKTTNAKSSVEIMIVEDLLRITASMCF